MKFEAVTPKTRKGVSYGDTRIELSDTENASPDDVFTFLSEPFELNRHKNNAAVFLEDGYLPSLKAVFETQTPDAIAHLFNGRLNFLRSLGGCEDRCIENAAIAFSKEQRVRFLELTPVTGWADSSVIASLIEGFGYGDEASAVSNYANLLALVDGFSPTDFVTVLNARNFDGLKELSRVSGEYQSRLGPILLGWTRETNEGRDLFNELMWEFSAAHPQDTAGLNKKIQKGLIVSDESGYHRAQAEKAIRNRHSTLQLVV